MKVSPLTIMDFLLYLFQLIRPYFNLKKIWVTDEAGQEKWISKTLQFRGKFEAKSRAFLILFAFHFSCQHSINPENFKLQFFFTEQLSKFKTEYHCLHSLEYLKFNLSFRLHLFFKAQNFPKELCKLQLNAVSRSQFS